MYVRKFLFNTTVHTVLVPKINILDAPSFNKNQNGLLTCEIIGQPGTSIHWIFTGYKGNSNEFQNSLTKLKNKKNDLEYEYSSTLTVFPNVTR